MKVKLFYSTFLKDEIEKLNLKEIIKKKFEVMDDLEKVDFCISLGGDGSVLYSVQFNKPVLGVSVKNDGSAGAMCIVDSADLEDAIEKIKSGDYTIEKRAKIEAEINGKYFGEALNDFYLIRDPWFDETIRYEVKSDSLHFIDKADGVIVCTPIGLTAYNRSALLGSIFYSRKVNINDVLEDKIIAVTPICSTLMEKQRIVRINSTVKVKPIRCTNAILKGDGIKKMRINVGDEILIRRGRNDAEFIVPAGFKKPQQQLLENLF
ncbi:MAG: hypothetical protein QXP04_04830 [Candidatus Nanoarchaeia archaeon]|nr:hypothetical protein [Candidatus Jingweiarchaeum tengchongense]